MRIAVLTTALSTAVVSLALADPAAAAIKKTQTNIAPQELSSALRILAADRHLQILYTTETVENRRTSGAVGEFTVDEALTRLLGGTGLVSRYIDDNTITVYAVAANEGQPQAGSRRSPSGGRMNDSTKGATSTEGSKSFWQRFRLAQAEARDTTRTSEAGSPDDDSALKNLMIEEVVVTAQKREERLQDVPISISLLQGEALDRSSSVGIVDALRQVPGVLPVVTASGARSNRTDAIVIRGVSSQGGSATTAYYLDSIPFSFTRQSYAVDASAYDLERVEVLRGPQGTLYGANALNGVVRILTQDADPTRYEGKARVGGSHTAHGEESYRADLAVNLPLWQDKAALRAVVGYQNLGGWIDKPIGKDTNDAELANYRLKLNVAPTDNLTIDALAWISRSDYNGHAGSSDNRTSPSIYEEPSFTDFDAFGLQAVYELPLFTLTSMTSYVDFAQTARVDFSPVDAVNRPHSFFINSNENKVVSQELVLNSNNDGRWRWIAGGYYRRADEQLYALSYHRLTGALIRGYQAPTIQVTKSDAFAFFGEITRGFLDGQLEITAGLRYFDDTIEERELSRLSAPGGIPALGLANTDGQFDKLSPRLVLSWRPGDDITIYASYAQGFRSGINQLPTLTELAPQFPSAEPDTLDNFEVGAKGDLFQGRVRFDSALYYLKWKDVQQSLSVVVIPPNTASRALVNAASASGLGVDIALSAELLEGFTLGATLNWNNLESDEDVLFGGRLFIPKGGRLDNSTKRTLGLSADYRLPLGNNYDVRASISANHATATITGRLAPAGTAPYVVAMNEATWRSQASLDLISSRGWTATLFAENLFDEDALVYGDVNTPLWNTFMRPLTVGVQLEHRF